ncbi:MAG TPA: hypothetical protein VGR12_04075 [Solirubrobacteraceae bacterium]|nr:hypothetical protein [Solirubrobacteraceae bacterium]
MADTGATGRLLIAYLVLRGDPGALPHAEAVEIELAGATRKLGVSAADELAAALRAA